MTILGVYFIVLFAHFLAGLFQVQAQGTAWNSPVPKAVVYSLTLTAGFVGAVGLLAVPIPIFYSAIAFLGFTFLTSLVVELITTRTFNWFVETGRLNALFAGVGFEELLHQYIILVALIWLIG